MLGREYFIQLKTRTPLVGIDLSSPDSTGSNSRYSGAFLVGVDLSGAYLVGTDLSGANLSRANPSTADLSGVDLRRVNPSGVENTLTQDQLDSACGDERTKLPPGLTIKHCEQ